MAEKKKVVVEQIKKFTSQAGNDYTFQKVKPSSWLDIMDDVDAEKKGQRKRLYSSVLEHIVVQPKLVIDDFEDLGFAEMDEVVTNAIRFQQGK